MVASKPESGAALAPGPAHADSDFEAQQRPTVVLQPSRGFQSLQLDQIWRFRDLLWAFASRDVKLRYKQTVLGAIWVVFQPLMASGIFTVVFGKIAGLESEKVPYFVFAFASMMFWSVWSGTLGKASGSLVGNANLISKVAFPRLILPLSTTLSTLLDFCVALGVFVILAVVFHVSLTPAILVLPVVLLLFLMLASGIGVVTASLAVPYRDVQYIVPVLLQLLLYASPVAYDLNHPKVAPYRHFFEWNPLTGLFELARWSLLGYPFPPLPLLIYSVVASVSIFALGVSVFRSMEKRFADVI